MEPLTKEHIQQHFEKAAKKAFCAYDYDYDPVEVSLKREAFIDGCWEGFNFCIESTPTHNNC